MNCKLSIELQEIIKIKKTNICLAADVDTVQDLCNLIESVGNYICILKLHHDVISDWTEKQTYIVSQLNRYKKDYNFLIWDDRKYADIGYIMAKQVRLNSWSDIVSIHPIVGFDSVSCISSIKPIIVIGELSTYDSLFNKEYINYIQQNHMKLQNLIGIVCQHKMSDTVLNIVPGIGLKTSTDNAGQQHTNIRDSSKSFADIYVIGRSITKSDDPKKTICSILDLIKQ